MLLVLPVRRYLLIWSGPNPIGACQGHNMFNITARRLEKDSLRRQQDGTMVGVRDLVARGYVIPGRMSQRGVGRAPAFRVARCQTWTPASHL